MSETRKRYFIRLVGRVLVLILMIALCFSDPQKLFILDGFSFFKAPSPLHLLWLIWVADMVLQIFPIKNKLALSLKSCLPIAFGPFGK